MKTLRFTSQNRKIRIVLDEDEDYEGGTPVMVYLKEKGQEECGATWNCYMGEGMIEHQEVTREEAWWIIGQTSEVNAFFETMEVAS